MWPKTKKKTHMRKQTNSNSYTSVQVNTGCCGVIKAFRCGAAELLCLTGSMNVLLLRDMLWNCRDLEFGRDIELSLLWKKKKDNCGPVDALNASLHACVLAVCAFMCDVQVGRFIYYIYLFVWWCLVSVYRCQASPDCEIWLGYLATRLLLCHLLLSVSRKRWHRVNMNVCMHQGDRYIILSI